MGLDMYAISVNQAYAAGQQFDINVDERDGQGNPSAVKAMCSWRKFSVLDQWMRELCAEKGGDAEGAGVNVRLDAGDVRRLAQNFAAGDFGQPGRLFLNDYQKLERFIAKAEDEVKRGRSIVYMASY